MRSLFIRNYYLNETYQRFDYVIVDEKCREFALEVISRVQKELQQLTMSILIKYVEASIKHEIILETSSIIFIDFDKDFGKLHDKFTMKYITTMKFHHIVIFQNSEGNQPNLGDLILFYDSLALHMSFIVQQNRDVENLKMLTYELSRENCEAKIKVVNEFSNSKQKWITDN